MFKRLRKTTDLPVEHGSSYEEKRDLNWQDSAISAFYIGEERNSPGGNTDLIIDLFKQDTGITPRSDRQLYGLLLYLNIMMPDQQDSSEEDIRNEISFHAGEFYSDPANRYSRNIDPNVIDLLWGIYSPNKDTKPNPQSRRPFDMYIEYMLKTPIVDIAKEFHVVEETVRNHVKRVHHSIFRQRAVNKTKIKFDIQPDIQSDDSFTVLQAMFPDQPIY